ncbi:uncharacterized protein BX663DRAFT_507517 [Cokeromyces recurvatus]|uniref:uncharacterized protein n=1 Tax=Cokeromyces recurvatus TaxID=90255 RepID=UPI002220714A|nr:uncharacterized protein BX663DRAFT_507517 [Cokeromyces recurvatus]KAI7903768.1 hypothetical protein BX663DRAFT_507517 [Cokeromyces recurvatus]
MNTNSVRKKKAIVSNNERYKCYLYKYTYSLFTSFIGILYSANIIFFFFFEL